MKLLLDKAQKLELIVALVFLVPPLYAFWEMSTAFVEMEMHTGGGEMNAALFPRLISILLIFVIGIRIIRILLGKDVVRPEDHEVTIPKKELAQNRKKALLIFIIFSVYLVSLNYLGYYAATPFAMAALFAVLGFRRPLPLILLSLGTTAVMWFIFSQLLNLVLPVGRLGLYL